MTDVEVDGLFIDGELYTVAKLSFREQREMRDEIAKIAPEGSVDLAGQMDIIPAMVYVVRKRADPEYTMDAALDVKPDDLRPPEPKESGRPPRKSRSS